MPEEIMVDEDLKIIKIIAVGEVTAEDQSRMTGLIEEIANERGIFKLLVDGTKATSFPDTVTLFQHGVRHSDRIRNVKTAVALLPDAGTELGFMEDVIFNRGGTTRIFDSLDVAIAWL